MCGIIAEERPVYPVLVNPFERPLKKMKPRSTLATITTISRTATTTGETPRVPKDPLNFATDLVRVPHLMIACGTVEMSYVAKKAAA